MFTENKIEVPQGRITVEGTILKIKENDDRYNEYKNRYKMLFQDDRGFKLWGSLPQALNRSKAGVRISFTATLKPSDNDPYFGFFSRPTKIEAKDDKSLAVIKEYTDRVSYNHYEDDDEA